MKHSSFFIVYFFFKIILFENQYQTFDTEFHHEIKHLEVRRKYSTSYRIFNSLLSI